MWGTQSISASRMPWVPFPDPGRPSTTMRMGPSNRCSAMGGRYPSPGDPKPVVPRWGLGTRPSGKNAPSAHRPGDPMLFRMIRRAPWIAIGAAGAYYLDGAQGAARRNDATERLGTLVDRGRQQWQSARSAGSAAGADSGGDSG